MARRRSEEGVRAGRLLAELRERHHLTQEVAAQLLKVGNRTVQNWEAGVSIPRWPNRVKLSKLYGIDPAEILGPAQPPIEMSVVMRLGERLEVVESELSRHANAIEALQTAVEESATVRAQTAAKTAQRRARGTPRTGDRRGRA